MKKLYCTIIILFLIPISVMAQLCLTQPTGTTWNESCSYADFTERVDFGIVNNSDITLTVDNFTFGSVNGFGDDLTFTVPVGSTLTITGNLLIEYNVTLLVNGTLNVDGGIIVSGSAFGVDNGGATFNISGSGNINTSYLESGWANDAFGRDPAADGGFTGELPVELTFFQATTTSTSVNLEWETATELNASHFDVQRSSDRKNWETLGIVQANGNSQTAISYEFEDESPATVAYYRLFQVDFDGASEVFGPIQVNFGEGKLPLNAVVMPNNISNGESIQIGMSGLTLGSDLKITVYNNQGYTVVNKNIKNIESGTLLKMMDFTQNLQKGMYYIVFNSGNEITKEKLLVR